MKIRDAVGKEILKRYASIVVETYAVGRDILKRYASIVVETFNLIRMIVYIINRNLETN